MKSYDGIGCMEWFVHCVETDRNSKSIACKI